MRNKKAEVDRVYVVSVISRGKFWHLLLERTEHNAYTINGHAIGEVGFVFLIS